MGSLFEVKKPGSEGQEQAKAWLLVLKHSLKRPEGSEALGEAKAILLCLSRYMDPPPILDPYLATFRIVTVGTAKFFSIDGRRMLHKELIRKRFTPSGRPVNTFQWLRAKRRLIDKALQDLQTPDYTLMALQAIFYEIEGIYRSPAMAARELEEAFLLGRAVQMIEETRCERGR